VKAAALPPRNLDRALAQFGGEDNRQMSAAVEIDADLAVLDFHRGWSTDRHGNCLTGAFTLERVKSELKK